MSQLLTRSSTLSEVVVTDETAHTFFSTDGTPEAFKLKRWNVAAVLKHGKRKHAG